MSKLTPEEILLGAFLRHTGDDEPLQVEQIKALADNGYVIVDRKKLGAVLRAQVRSDKLTDQIIDELAQERGGT